MILKNILEELGERCRQWGPELLRLRDEQRLATSLKDDASPVTEGDLYVHRQILESLHRLTPEIPVMSEESAQIDAQERARWTRHWLVDPIDGTKEYIKGSPDFTINIALVEGQRVIAAVVGVPAFSEVYIGEKSSGCEVWRGSSREVVRCRTTPIDPLVLLSRSHRSVETDLMRKYAPLSRTEQMGSSLKFCRVAEGYADAYFRMFPTNEWDTAAGQAILEAAGGGVCLLDGSPLVYSRENLRNPPFLAFSDVSYWLTFLRESHREYQMYRQQKNR